MSSRPILAPHSVVTNASMGSSVTSAVTIIQMLSMISYQIIWTSGSTPIGVVTVQVSNNYELNKDGTVRNAGTWTTIDGISEAISGNSGSGFIDIDQHAGYAMRLVYTRTSGSGTLNVVVVGKVH